MTVHAYLTELRRHYACALLEKASFGARAALESGFSGYQQMRRAVRRKQP